MAMTSEDVPWTPGKIHESNCRGDACKKLFKEKEDDWLGRKLPNGEQLSMPVWCPECREKRRAMHSMCIELEVGECDQDDREDDLQCEREGVLLEEVDMVVMVITEVEMVTQFHKMELGFTKEPKADNLLIAEAMELDFTKEPKAETQCEMEGLEEFLAGLETAQKLVTDVGASGEAEADAQVAGFRVMRGEEITIEPIVPMDHRMGGDRTCEQMQAAERFPTFMWEQEHVDDASEGANAEEIEEMKEAKLALPLDFKASADKWWQLFMDDEEQPKKVVPVEETRQMLRGMSIHPHDTAEAECGAEAEGSVVMSSVDQQIEKDAAYSRGLDQEDMPMLEKGDSEQRYNGKPPQNENRSATGACTSYAAAGTVTAALMQSRAVVEGKVAMFKHTPSEVSTTVKKKVTNEVMWMVHRQLRQWHREAGGVNIIDNEALIADWVTTMGRSTTFAKWIRQRIGEIDVSITRCKLPTMAVSAVTKLHRREALEVAVKWIRHKGAEAALFAPHGPQRWHLFDELLQWERMVAEKASEVAAAVKMVGDQVEAMFGVHCMQREVWKALQQMMASEDAWLHRDQPVHDGLAGSFEEEKLLAMMGTSLEVQKAQRVSALRRGAGVVALVEVAKVTAVFSAVDRRMCAWTHKHDEQSMELISTLLQGSVTAMRMWARVLAQGHEVTAVVQGGITDPDEVDWAKVVQCGSGHGKDPEVDIHISVQFADILGIHICAGDEEGMGGSSDDEPVARECGNGGQDVCGSNDSATQSVLLPEMPDFSSDDSDNSSSGEGSMLFEKRQAGKFGTHSVGVKIGTQKGAAGKHIDSANIIESPRKRKAFVVHNVEGHSGDEGCELDDSDVGSEFEAAMGESVSSVESGVSNFDSDDDKVCDVLRRRLGGSPVWTTNKDESRMEVEELDMSNMSVGEWCEAHQSESGSGSGNNSGSNGCEGERGKRTKQEATVTDADVMSWLEANQTPVREGRQYHTGGSDDNGSGSGSGCGVGSGSYCGSGSGSVSSNQKVSASLVQLDHGVLRIFMWFLPR
jgi:hypothetical protein